LGKWHRQFGQYREAYYYFQLALKNADKAADPKMTKGAAFNGLASVAYMLDDYNQSLHYFNQCLEMNRKDEACLKNRILAYLQLSQPDKALSDALKLTKEYRNPLEYQYLTAMAACQSGKQDIALSRMQKVAGISLNNHQVMYLTGLLLLQHKVYPNSLFFLQQADKISPKTIEYQLSLATAYYLDKQTGKSEAILSDIFNKHPFPVITAALKEVSQYHLDSDPVSFFENRLYSMIQASNVLHENKSAEP